MRSGSRCAIKQKELSQRHLPPGVQSASERGQQTQLCAHAKVTGQRLDRVATIEGDGAARLKETDRNNEYERICLA